MQLLSRVMDHVLASAGSASPSWWRPRVTPAVPRSRRFVGDPRSTSLFCFRNGRISEVQRRMITTAREDNVHALAIEGTFDDCQAIVKGLFNHHAFRDQRAAVGRQLDQLRSHRRAGRLLLHGGGGAWRAEAQGRLHGADRKLRRCLCWLCRAAAWDCRSTGWLIATNVNDILARALAERCLRGAFGDGDRLALHGHPGVVEFRTRCCSRPSAATRARCGP